MTESTSSGSSPSTDDGLPLGSLTDSSCSSDMSTAFDFDFSSAPVDGLLFDETNYNIGSFEPVNSHPASTEIAPPQTVSPKDIMGDSMSAPPSTTMTDLTTPGTSYEHSPWMGNTNETSPLFSEVDLDDGADNWPSLFEPTEDYTANASSNGSIGFPTQNFAGSPHVSHVAPKMSRTDSSPGSRSSQGARHSFSTSVGVSSRRRDKPLPAIHLEELNDDVSKKRARNTLAARKSRQKRMERTEQLEQKIDELEDEVTHWRNIALSKGHVE